MPQNKVASSTDEKAEAGTGGDTGKELLALPYAAGPSAMVAVWHMNAAKTRQEGAEQCLKRSVDTWTTMGVVAALVLTMTFPAVIDRSNYIPFDEKDDTPYRRAHLIFNFLTTLASMATVILVTILLCNANATTDEKHLQRFLMLVALPSDIVTLGLTVVMGIGMMGEMLAVIWETAEQGVAITLSAMLGFTLLAIGLGGGYIGANTDKMVKESLRAQGVMPGP